MSDHFRHTTPRHRSTKRSSASQPRIAASRNLAAALAAGFLGAVLASVATGMAGGGFLLCFLAYAVGGSTTLTGVALLQVARPLRPRLSRAIETARRPVAAPYSHYSH